MNRTDSRHLHAPAICVVGQAERSEFHGVMNEVRRLAGELTVRPAGSLRNCIADRTDRRRPELVIVLQSRMGEYTAADVRSVIVRPSGTGLLCCCGALCDSEMRHGSPWPVAVRMNVGETELLLESEISAIRQRKPRLPLTASPDEVFWFRRTMLQEGGRSAAPNSLTEVRILTGDAPLRHNAEQLLRDLGFDAFGHATTDELRALSRRPAGGYRKKNGENVPCRRLLLIDTDPGGGHAIGDFVTETVSEFRSEFDQIAGMTSWAPVACPAELDFLIRKTDPDLEFRRMQRRLSV